MHGSFFRSVLLAGMTMMMAASVGCQMGPQALKMGHPQYASAARSILDEQMLLNLVRLRYRQSPVWLEVTSISSQFTFDASGEISGTVTENVSQGGGINPDLLRISGNTGYSERPTITYNLLGGEDFLKRVLTPLSVENISLLAESGWRGDRVFRLTVERMNGLSNAPRASGPTPRRAPQYQQFLEAVDLMQFLADQDLLTFEFDTRIRTISDPLPVSKISAGDLIDAAKIGGEFKYNNDQTEMSLTQEQRVLFMRLAYRATETEGVARLRDLLHLSDDRLRYDIVDPALADFDPIENDNGLGNVAIDTRSLMGVLYYLSNAVSVPDEAMDRGPATRTLDEGGELFDWHELLNDLFVVHHSRSQPIDAAIAVPYRGWWYYIRSD